MMIMNDGDADDDNDAIEWIGTSLSSVSVAQSTQHSPLSQLASNMRNIYMYK